MSNKTSFDFASLTSQERYKILCGTIVPRPIALVTTVDKSGIVNAAPISFFNCLSSEPPLLVLGLSQKGSGELSDTAKNIRDTGVFVVNVVSRPLLEKMNICAIPFPPEVDELDAAGLVACKSEKIAAPRVSESPASFECRKTISLSVNPSREIIIGEVLVAHIRSDLVNGRLHTDQVGLDPVGRMGGNTYAFLDQTFELKTPSLQQWEELRNADEGLR